jgi:UTP--glucose-1-phosphate uridylyltransferase
MASPIHTVVFPVAGLGTRFLPATKAVPKEMLPVVDRPLIQWAVEEAAAAGCTRFVFVTAPEKSAILQHFSPAPQYTEALTARGKTKELALLQAGLPQNAELIEVYQDQPLGLGHAIWCAKQAVGDAPFAVILPDDMVQHSQGCLSQMVEAHARVGGNLVAVENVPADQTHHYGVLDPASESEGLVAIQGLVEKPAQGQAPSSPRLCTRSRVPSRLARPARAAKCKSPMPWPSLSAKCRCMDCAFKAPAMTAAVGMDFSRPMWLSLWRKPVRAAITT